MPKHKDGRDLDRITQERVRILACRRILNGESVTAVMESCGYSRTTYYKWLDEFNESGEAGLKRKTGSGSKPLISSKHYKKTLVSR